MSMLDRTYQWVMRLAAGPRALPVLALVSFAESSFFPIPPDVLMIPMVLADRDRAWRIATICTIASVLGGFLGYAIGYYAFEAIGLPVLKFYGVTDRYVALQDLYARWGALLIIIKGATPIPYKLVTIASGAFHFNLVAFAICSLIARSMRFFLLATVLWRFGEPVRDFVEKRLLLVTSAFAVALVGGFLALRFL